MTEKATKYTDEFKKQICISFRVPVIVLVEYEIDLEVDAISIHD